MIVFLISLIVLFNISSLIHFFAAKKVYKTFDIMDNNKEKIRSLKRVIQSNFITIVLFFFIIFIDGVFINNFGLNDFWISIFDNSFTIIFVFLSINTIRLFCKLNIRYFSHSFLNIIINILLFPLGFYEYSLSKYFKEFTAAANTSEQDKRDIKKFLLQKFNLYNLFTSLLLTILLFVALLTITKRATPIRIMYISVISLMILIRAGGRSIEIICAFYKDTVNPNYKTSNLKNTDRLQLAIKSFFELLFIFAGVYCVLGQQFIINYIFNFGHYIQTFDLRYIFIAIIDSFKNGTIVGADFLLSADSINLPKNEFIRHSTTAIFVVLHALTNLVLTLFSIARYLSDENNKMQSQY